MRQPATGQVRVSGGDCPVSGCGGQRERSRHAMCPRCWSVVNRSLQLQVSAMLGARNRVAAGRPLRDQLRRAVDAYEDARARAIAVAERAIRARAAA